MIGQREYWSEALFLLYCFNSIYLVQSIKIYSYLYISNATELPQNPVNPLSLFANSIFPLSSSHPYTPSLLALGLYTEHSLTFAAADDQHYSPAYHYLSHLDYF